MSTAKKSERPEQNRDLRCQFGPSAKDSVIFSGGNSSKNYGADQRLQISDLHFDKFSYASYFCLLEDKVQDRGMYLCIISYGKRCNGSKKWRWLIQWMNQDLRHLLVVFSMPNFEVLDARIASALNKIIQNYHFRRRISLEEQKAQKQDWFLRGRQIAYLIYEHFRVIGSHDSDENYTYLLTISIRNDDIQEFDSKWDGILLPMTKIPHDDILEGLYKLRIRESEKLKTVLEFVRPGGLIRRS